ncbi:MAG: hypothetical protein KGK01_05595 [Bradyrhizobium sp.]|uniref:hypothetical protein n=1 Tax=Bradyrhizobium sp. TaxID=376 RepID=UPI001C2823E2|nr:hypothetical protein [Bradyrhizobium sp.]MBU6462094.1 hypothetical protein [Pseudomonadota bacterium]MDE2066825.1 hypothetical protein [Bradyrhizobium sp.]MDE2241924.1 hypothetical protein [Bradyrhizobium sp.]
MHAIKSLLVVTGIVLAIGLSLIEYLNFTGYCYAEARYLNDDELTRIAIADALKHVPDTVGIVHYSSVEDVLAKNPDCCAVHRQHRGLFEDLLPGTWVRAFGWYIAAIEVAYRYRETPSLNYLDSFTLVNACGRIGERLGSYSSSPRKSQ